MKIIGEALENTIDSMDLLRAMTREIRKAFSMENAKELIEHCVKIGFIPKLTSLLDVDSDSLRADAIWALANVAALSDSMVESIVQLEVPNKIMKIMKAGSNLVKEQCLWLIANIMGTNAKYRDEILKTDFVEQIISIIGKVTVNIKVLENACWAISNICKTAPAPPISKVNHL